MSDKQLRLEAEDQRLAKKLETLTTGTPEEAKLLKRRANIKAELQKIENGEMIRMFGTAEPTTEQLERHLGIKRD